MTLEVLLTELNVTKAAERLNLSQPSVSVQLGKLRNIYNDPLLLPGPRGMLPTSRAVELLEPLRSALLELERVVGPQKRFDPATAEVTWSLGGSRLRGVGNSPPNSVEIKIGCSAYSHCYPRYRSTSDG